MEFDSKVFVFLNTVETVYFNNFFAAENGKNKLIVRKETMIIGTNKNSLQIK